MSMLKTIAGWFAPERPEPIGIGLGRNEPCWCGSGLKYKKCHQAPDEIQRLSQKRTSCNTT